MVLRKEKGSVPGREEEQVSVVVKEQEQEQDQVLVNEPVRGRDRG